MALSSSAHCWLAGLMLIFGCVGDPPSASADDESSSEDSTTTSTSSTSSTTTTTDTTTTDPSTTTDTTTTDPSTGTTTDPDTGGSTDESTDTGANLCGQTHQIALDAADAILSGDWELQQSQLGEGNIAVMTGMGAGSVLWEPDIPCDDTWDIWVRYWEQGAQDSYFVTLDGEPQPPATFEGDCTMMGDGYSWRELNWRDAMNQGPCEYLEDPWTADWTTGQHAMEVTYRESMVIARIIVINDPMFVPGPND